METTAVADQVSLETDFRTPKSNEKEKSGLAGFLDKLTKRFVILMVRYPYVNIIVVFLLFLWAGLIGFVPALGAQSLPDFTDPIKGFQPRDTKISNRAAAYSNLGKSYKAGQLSDRPFANPARSKRSTRSVSPVSACSFYSSIDYWVESNKIIYEHKSGGNLLTVDRLHEMCRLHQRVMVSNKNYQSYVNKYSMKKACPSFSIPTYIALYSNRTTCSQITSSDITNFMNFIKQCLPSYKNGGIKNCMTDYSKCPSLPHPCNTYQTAVIVYNVFHFLSDANFAENPDFLKLALVSDNINSPYSDSVIDNLYNSVYKTKVKDLSKNSEGSIKIAAYEFYNLKFKTFNSQLFVEGALLSIAMILVLVFIIIYSGSIFIGLMTFLCIIIAVVIGYFCYGIIFRLPFFPFLNVLTLIFLVGIGADDAFVYMGAWKEAKRLMPRTSDKTFEKSLIEWTSYSLKHATVAMLVTSFTTAAAFYASATSKIIAIRCFGVYAGTCILLNYLLMVVCFPVVVIISERYLSPCMARIAPKCCSHNSSVTEKPEDEPEGRGRIVGAWTKFNQVSGRFFEAILPKIIKKFRYLFIIIFLALGIGGLIVIFVSPKLGLPISKDFIMFSRSHSLEQYPLFYKSKFSFGRAGSSWYMPIRMVFGVKSENTASMMKPNDKGYLQLKASFSISTPEEQTWLHNFCVKLQNATFVDKTSQTTCSKFLQMWSTLAQPCGSYPTLQSPCCNRTMPISRADHDLCLVNFTKINPISSMSGLLYDRQNKARALVIDMYSTSPYTEAFDKSKKLFDQVESWMTGHLRNAPSNFADGWWHTELSFYDLQSSLAVGTQVSLGVSVAIAFGVVLFTTWNFLISLYSIICIIFVISVSIGVLVLSGWRLNILESIVFSVAAGLSVDFTLHFGVAYRTATDKRSKESRVKYSLVHLGSAVSMGAITTFISGLVMAPATVLVYIQLSHFLMTLMTFSWLYATFFFLSVCSVIGPTNNFCQLSLGWIFSRKTEEKHVEAETNANPGFEEHELNKIAAVDG